MKKNFNWNVLTTLLVIATGLYWIVGSDYGLFFQLTGCAAYIGSVVLFVKKNSYAQKIMNMLNDKED